MWVFFYIYFILVSTVFIPIKVPDQWWIPKECLFLILGLIFIGLSWINKEKKFKFTNKWIFLILLYSLISFLFHFYLPIIFNDGIGYPLRIWNLRPTLNLIVGLLLIQTMVENTKDFKVWVNLSKVMIWTAFSISCYTIIQWAGIDPIFNSGKYNFNFLNGFFERETFMVGFLGNKFLTSNFIALISSLCLMFKGFRYKIIYCIMIFGVFMSDSILSLGCMFVTFLVYNLLSKNFKTCIAAFVVFGCLTGLSMKHEVNFLSHSGRFQLWEQSIDKSFSEGSGFLGRGLGSFPAEQFRRSGRKALSAHNEWVQILFEGGIVMSVLCIIYLFDLFKRLYISFIKEKSTLLICFISSMIGYMIVMTGGFSLRIAPLALIGIIYIAGLELLTINRRLI